MNPRTHDFSIPFMPITCISNANCRTESLPGLCRAIKKEQVLIFNWLHDIAANRRSQPEEFHSTLAEAVCSGDQLVADTAMRAHVQYGLDQVLERLANYDKEDVWRLKDKRY